MLQIAVNVFAVTDPPDNPLPGFIIDLVQYPVLADVDSVGGPATADGPSIMRSRRGSRSLQASVHLVADLATIRGDFLRGCPRKLYRELGVIHATLASPPPRERVRLPPPPRSPPGPPTPPASRSSLSAPPRRRRVGAGPAPPPVRGQLDTAGRCPGPLLSVCL